MSRIDTTERAADEAKTLVGELEQRWETQTADLKREAQKLQDSIATAESKRTRQKTGNPLVRSRSMKT